VKASLMSCFLSLLLGGDHFFSSTSALPGSSLALISSFFSDFIFYCTRVAYLVSLVTFDFLVELTVSLISALCYFGSSFLSMTYLSSFLTV
jgi:hypothetical protein